MRSERSGPPFIAIAVGVAAAIFPAAAIGIGMVAVVVAGPVLPGITMVDPEAIAAGWAEAAAVAGAAVSSPSAAARTWASGCFLSSANAA